MILDKLKTVFGKEVVEFAAPRYNDCESAILKYGSAIEAIKAIPVSDLTSLWAWPEVERLKIHVLKEMADQF